MYQAEIDVHFPHLTVGQTLLFAALARTPENRLPGVSRQKYAEHLRDVVMAVFGLSHTINTKVGNDYVRGVSGGERKRVSIAEVTLSQSPIQCWDNSTRGLDSATALEFARTLRLSTDLAKTSAIVAMYQASQPAYDVSTISAFLACRLTHYQSHRYLTRYPCYMRDDKSTLVQQFSPNNTSPTWVMNVLTVKLRLIFSHLSQILPSALSNKGLKTEYQEHRMSSRRSGKTAASEHASWTKS